MIAGTKSQRTDAARGNVSCFASRPRSFWGRATWLKAWVDYNEPMPARRTTTSVPALADFFPDRVRRPLYRTVFDLAHKPGVGSWAPTRCHHLLSPRQLSLVATHDLGPSTGAEGNRGRAGDSNQFRPTAPMSLPLSHAAVPELRPQYDRLVTSWHQILRDWMRALLTLRLRRVFGRR